MSSNPNYKPSEGKREEFRKYLEKTGVMDALTKVLVSLYEEPDKPENAIEYICNKLASQICGETLDSLRARIEDSQTKAAQLEQEIAALKGGDASVTGEEGSTPAAAEQSEPAAPEDAEGPPPAE